MVIATDINIGGVEEHLHSADFDTSAVRPFFHDVASEDDWRNLFALAKSEKGWVDVLVNNAGIISFGDFEQIDLTQWRRTHAVNLDSVFLGARAAIPMMKEGGGVILNISSVLGIVGDHCVVDYSSAKTGVRNFTKSMALHFGARGYPIRINSVHPGYVRTDMILKPAVAVGDIEGKLESGVAKHPIGRLAVPSDIANTVLFLASDETSFITGAEIAVDGGYLAQ